MQLLRGRLKIAELGGLGGAQDIVGQLNHYLSGWADAFIRTAPDLIDGLGGEIETVMCDASSSDTQLLLMSQIVKRVPELGSEKGFDCVFKRGREDAVLYDSLDAWREASLPESEALQQLSANSKEVAAVLRREDPAEIREAMESPAQPPEKLEVETAPLQERDVMLALRHAQRLGNADTEKSLAAVLARMRAATPQEEAPQP